MRHVLACAVAVMLLAACSSPEATPTPSARPSTSAATSSTPTPSPSLTPSPSMTMGYRVEDVQAAEAVYREVIQLMEQLERQPSPRAIPRDLENLLMGAVRLAVLDLADQMDKNGVDGVNGASKVAWVRPLRPSKSDPANSVVLEGCIDRTGKTFHTRDGSIIKASATRDRAVFEYTGSGWRYSMNSAEELKTCS